MGFSTPDGAWSVPDHEKVARGRASITQINRFGALQGFGNPQVSFATESKSTNREELGMDTLELAVEECHAQGGQWVGGGRPLRRGLRQLLKAVREAAGWDRRGPLDAAPGPNVRSLGWHLLSLRGLLSTRSIIRVLETAT